MDPELVGPDPVWKCIKSGKGHVYFILILAMILAVAVSAGAPRWLSGVVAALIAGVFSDLWAHLYLH
jgi:uncharacterized membrane protein YczE